MEAVLVGRARGVGDDNPRGVTGRARPPPHAGPRHSRDGALVALGAVRVAHELTRCSLHMVSTVSAVRAVRAASAALVMSALALGAVGCGGGIGREAAEPPSLASLLAKPSPTPTPP